MGDSKPSYLQLWPVQFLLLVPLIGFALTFALTFDFIWLRFRGAQVTSYWNDSGEALASLLPLMVVAGLACVVVFDRLRKNARLTLTPAGAIALALFWSAIALTSTLWGGPQINRFVWFTAYIFSAACYATTIWSRDPRFPLSERIRYSRPSKLLVDGTIVGVTFGLSYLVRFDAAIPAAHFERMTLTLPYVVMVYLASNIVWGVYSCIWRYTGFKEAVRLGESVTTAALLLLAVRIGSLAPTVLPLGVLAVHPMLSYVALLGARIMKRAWHTRKVAQAGGRVETGRSSVLLIGAGSAGRSLLRELEYRHAVQVVGFLDDDPWKIGRMIHGKRVLGSLDELEMVVKDHDIREIILSIPSASRSLTSKLVARCEALEIKVSSVPSLSEMLLEGIQIDQIRPIRMEDLLGRPRVEYSIEDTHLIEGYRNQKILVTGAGGSIGSELVHQLLHLSPAQLILLDKDENGLFEIGLEAKETGHCPIVEVVGDVRDRNRLERVFTTLKPEVVFHAAAYKHVPMMEHNPSEAIFNNVIGSQNLVELSARFGAGKFVLISTDKAVNPTNIMGASKRLAELILQREAVRSQSTKFCAVRFGNVLGSRASVVPLFRKRIEQGKKTLQVTHPEIRRYFMTIPEAVQLVIQAGSLGADGDVFVLDMGDPVKIADLARDLIELSGLEPGRDIGIEFTGLRPGEKLFEELILSTEKGFRTTKYPKIFRVTTAPRDWENLDNILADLWRAAESEDTLEIARVLGAIEIGYQSQLVG